MDLNSIKNTEEPSENNKETSSNLKNINRISSGESQKLNMLLNDISKYFSESVLI